MNRNVKNSRDAGPSHITNSRGSSRADFYLDDETISRMIASFGPLEHSQFAAVYHPQGTYGLGEILADCEGPISWRQESLRKLKTEPNKNSKAMQIEDSFVKDRQYLLQNPEFKNEKQSDKYKEAKQESILEWFDRSVEKELQKRRDTGGGNSFSPVDPALAAIKHKHSLNLSRKTIERLAETSASRVETAAQLETDFSTELTEAVKKLAEAETMCNYATALQAAEEAVQNAPPELREQAAAAGAQYVQTELSQIRETVDGPRPIEVIGYVGLTKPVHPKKP